MTPPRTLGAAAVVTVLVAAALPAALFFPAESPPATAEPAISGLLGNQASLRSVSPISPDEAEGAEYLPGSRVLRLADGRLHYLPPGSAHSVHGSADAPDAHAAAAADRAWLDAGTIPGRNPAGRALATRALLDMRTLTRPNGGAVVGWHTYWKFVWPRDASWMSAAFAATGHHEEAAGILRFLARAQRGDGTWDARYHPFDATPVEDDRRWQLDANGWVPWAAWFWWTTVAHTAQTRQQLDALWPMVRAAADYAAASLDHRGLPPPSPDYWETGTDKPNLGTAAPLLAGLRAAADLATELRDFSRAYRWSRAASRLAAGIETHFAPHYARTIDPESGDDAAVTFLAPPFAPYDAGVDAAVQEAAQTLTVGNGGVIPGEEWPGDPREAWTAETGWFALAAAAAGRVQDASRWLDWIASHRTSLGGIPEKVDDDGRPASVGPFAWTGAVVLLSLQAGELPTPPTPKEP